MKNISKRKSKELPEGQMTLPNINLNKGKYPLHGKDPLNAVFCLAKFSYNCFRKTEELN